MTKESMRDLEDLLALESAAPVGLDEAASDRVWRRVSASVGGPLPPEGGSGGGGSDGGSSDGAPDLGSANLGSAEPSSGLSGPADAAGEAWLRTKAMAGPLVGVYLAGALSGGLATWAALERPEPGPREAQLSGRPEGEGWVQSDAAPVEPLAPSQASEEEAALAHAPSRPRAAPEAALPETGVPMARPQARTDPSDVSTREPNRVDERSLIEQARAALARGLVGPALDALRRHRVAFPRGTFTEEREALLVAALWRSGQATAAEARAEDFLRRYPTSLFRGLLEPPREIAPSNDGDPEVLPIPTQEGSLE